MKRVVYSMFTLVILVAAMAAFAWFAMPQVTARALLALNNSSAGLTAKTIQTDFGEVGYLEGGEGETVVLVHGIYSRKEHWIEIAKALVSDYHVIVLDLPGFGDNAKLPTDQYRLRNQQRNLAHIFDVLELKKVHLGANSMGAHIAALMAVAKPEMVATLAFIGSPLGVPSPIASDMEKALAQGDIPLLVRTPDDFQARSAWLSPNTLSLPSPILESWMNIELEQAVKNEEIWHAVHNQSQAPNLVELAPALEMETLIIWCEPDRVFHVSGAAVLADKLPKPNMQILDDCGHVPMIDRPVVTAQVYRLFLQTAVTD